MRTATLIFIYTIFFFSGFAALIYEIVWTRYLCLIFGGSHLAVTTVLSVFMAGLALGSYFIGKKIDNQKQLLRFFGLLELGTAVSAIIFIVLMRLYPAIYIKVAQFAPESTLYLSAIRFTFATMALIVPTTLMGGTLPVITTFATRVMGGAGTRLSFLYGCNTIGAVSGAAATGFFMLRNFSMQNTLASAVIINILVGISALAVERFVVAGKTWDTFNMPSSESVEVLTDNDLLPRKLVLWGIGVSGFCAMGYEVLWSRILCIAIGASTYGFTILLMSFLSGIGIGSAAFGFLRRISGTLLKKSIFSLRNSIIYFGLVQVIIGVTALLATTNFSNMPGYMASLHIFFQRLTSSGDQFQIVQLTNFVLAFSIMFIPAFFMGFAFPLAGDIYSRDRTLVGRAVGEVLFFNTIGAILGAVCSGLLFVYLLGIQRSLQIIVLINIGYGLYVVTSTRKGNVLKFIAVLASLSAIMVPVAAPEIWRLWDPRLYAIYQSNKPESYGTDELNELYANIDVRYYAEGAQAIVSSVQSGDIRYFITNGRVEASNAHQDMQCQYTLGHLPMLLHRNPRKVFVLGTGSGMTLGAVSVHPSVEQITLVELEPSVLGVAKTFGSDNHYILNKPNSKLKVAFNDGRNYLLTTSEKFDVITADPVHPLFSGAGYLYSTEYFHIVAQRLNHGGIMCQWLPLYELTAEDLKSVIRTIMANFTYSMIWVTHYDAEIVASNSPIVIDEEALEERIANPQIMGDLRQVKMGSAEDLLSYFVMGSKGANAYSGSGRINTDDNLYLEFSAPRSIGKEYLRGANLADILKHRERILPFLHTIENETGRVQKQKKWEANYQAAILADKIHVLNISGKSLTYEFTELATDLEERYPRFAPWRFIKEESENVRGGVPKILQELDLHILDENGALITAQFSAILVRKDYSSARLFFVDDNSHTVFGTLRIRGHSKAWEIEKIASEVMNDVQSAYKFEKTNAAAVGKSYPSLFTMFPIIKTIVGVKIDVD